MQCCYLVLQSHLTPCGPMDCSPPGSSVHGILQTRILEWDIPDHVLLQGIFLTRGSNSCLLHCSRLFTTKAQGKPETCNILGLSTSATVTFHLSHPLSSCGQRYFFFLKNTAIISLCCGTVALNGMGHVA